MSARSLDRGQNFGSITTAIASGDLCINAADHAPGMVVPRHEHANAYLCVVMAGRLEVRARQAVQCPAGSVIAYPAGLAHSNRFSDQPGRCINIHLGPTWIAEPWIREWLRDCRHLQIGAERRSLRTLARELEARDEAAPLAAASAAIALLADVMRANVACAHCRDHRSRSRASARSGPAGRRGCRASRARRAIVQSSVRRDDRCLRSPPTRRGSGSRARRGETLARRDRCRRRVLRSSALHAHLPGPFRRSARRTQAQLTFKFALAFKTQRIDDR